MKRILFVVICILSGVCGLMSLEHKIYYKYEGNTPEYIKKELKECADLVTFLDSKMLAINEEVRSIREENRE